MEKSNLHQNLKAHFEIDRHPICLVPENTIEVIGTVFQQLTFTTQSGEPIRAFYAPPRGGKPSPAVLYIHAHGGRYDIGADELIHGRPALVAPMGQVLADLGYAVLCIDLPGFGSRADKSESELAKKSLWFGGSLAGQMAGELHSAFEFLYEQEGIDPERIGLFGISMGATLAYWLAAAERRVSMLAHLCCLANFDELIKTGAHDLHGIYLTIPGLLNTASNGQIAGSIAPRPQLIGIGDQDPLTPSHAADPALAELATAYSDAAQNLIVIRESETGHIETPRMRKAIIEFFKSFL